MRFEDLFRQRKPGDDDEVEYEYEGEMTTVGEAIQAIVDQQGGQRGRRRSKLTDLVSSGADDRRRG